MSDKPNKRKNPSNCISNTSQRNDDEVNCIPRLKNPNLEDTIAKCKKQSKRLRSKRAPRSKTSSNTEPEVCVDVEPMPSLSELDLMLADSGDVGGPSNNPVQERCVTPIQKPCMITKERMMSPRTLKEITTKMIEMISNLPTVWPPPIVPQKRKKNVDIPYIVGCKERLQVQPNPNRTFCKGNKDYGVNENSAQSEDEENSCPKKRRRSDEYNISNTIFSAKRDDIEARLKESDEDTLCSVSPDSHDTVAYDYTDKTPTRNIPRSFSPLPSTSKDNDTILKNEKRFTESMLIVDETIPKSENLFTKNMLCESLSNDVELIENYETIVIDDTISSDDDSCTIIESDIRNASHMKPIKVDYGTIDLCQNFDDDDILEVIDVDDAIAENKANNLGTVTFVEPTVSFTPKQLEETKECSPLRDIDIVTLSPNSASGCKFYDLIDVVIDSLYPRNSHPIGTFTTPSVQQMTENFTYNKEETISDVVVNYFSGPENRNCTTVKSENVVQKLTSWIPSTLHFSSQSNNNVPITHNVQVTQHSAWVPATNCVPVTTSCCVHARETPAAIPNNTPPRQTDVPRGFGDCPICMESLSNTAVASTLCGHIFCLNCIKASIRANGKKCPTCRKALKGVGYHPLFI